MSSLTTVLLMGLGRHGAHWLDFPEQLAAAGAGRVVTPDLPGTGQRRGEPPLTDVMSIAAAVEADLGPAPVHLIGISFGGMVALTLAHRFPERVAGVTVINASSGDVAPPWQRLRLDRVAVARVGQPLDRERALAGVLVNDPDRGAVAAARWRDIRTRDPVSPRTLLAHAWAAARFRLQPVRVPVRVVVGRGDRLVASSCSDRLAARLSVGVVAHPTGGHALFVDAPDWLANQVVAPPQELPAPAVHP